ncbi:MAG: hypothetical protein LC777_03040, partial [Actinobacteria bacterium]|nr:hypothetical protein [Actinomycetota bacterium]
MCARELRKSGRAYRWNGGDWRRGLSDRNHQSIKLRDARTPEEFDEAVAAILTWGGINRPMGREDRERIRRSLPVLDRIRDGGAGWQPIHARRIASTSKVYAAHDPDSWTIYDSRVALR